MQAVQRIKREKRMDGGKEKEEVDDPHTSAAKQKRPLRNGAELLPAERPSCSCVAACIRHYFPRQGRRLEPRWRASREFHPSEVLSKLRTGVSTHFLRFVQSSECEWIAVLRVTRGTHQFSLDFLSKWLEISLRETSRGFESLPLRQGKTSFVCYGKRGFRKERD